MNVPETVDSTSPRVYHISGHLDLTPEEFAEHYEPRLREALKEPGVKFVVGDAFGADEMTQAWLRSYGAEWDQVTVYHMFERAREEAEEVLVAEVWGNVGDDGHTDYVHQGWMFLTQKMYDAGSQPRYEGEKTNYVNTIRNVSWIADPENYL